MSERYATLFRCVAPQAQNNAPVLLTAGVLLGDRQTGSVLAQIKLQNISDKVISAVYASLMCIDAMNAPVEPAVDARYLDLNVKPGEHFADRQPIVVSNTTVRSFALRVTNIMFNDGTAWKCEEGAIFEVIPEYKNTYTSEQLEQLRLETGKREFVTSEAKHEYIKRCYCSQWNLHSNPVCVRCHTDFVKTAALADPVLLTQKYEDRKKSEAEEAERKRIEAERKAEEARIAREKAEKAAAEAAARAKAKAKKKAMILIPSLIVIAVLVITGGVMLNKHNQYNTAVGYLKAQEFDNARTAFTELGNYKDVDTLLQQLAADELYAGGDYAAAYEIYAMLPADYQTHEAEYAAKYEYATEMVSTQNYESAAAAFAELGSYKDSPEQFAMVEIAYKEKLASDYLNAGDFDSARAVYVSLGYDEKATECLYLLAQSQETETPWLSYANYIELGEYKDSKARAEALYGQRYESIGTEDANGLRAYYDPAVELYGLLDVNADVFVEPLYSDISINTNGVYTICLSGKYGVLSSDGQYLIEPLYDSVYEETGIGSTAFYKVSSAGKFGLINTDGTSFIPVEYDGITVFDGIGDTSYYQVESNTKVGFLNADGTSFIPVEYDGIAVFDGIAETSYYQVENNSKVGFLNADGTSFIPVEYDEIMLVKGVGETSYYQVENNTKIGFLNANGTVFIPVEYDDITLGTHEYFVKLNGKVGVATLEGTVLISPAYASVTRMDDGRYLASEKSLYGVIDMTGKIIVPLTYSKITLENTGTYTVTLNSKYGIVAYDGTVVHEPNMEQIRAGSNDGKYLMFRQDGLYGFLDASTFEVVVEAEWKNATIMYDGYAYIYNNLDKWGVISANGKVTVSPQWSYIKYFDDCGCALRSKDGSSSSSQCYLMNEKGSLVCDFSEHSSSTAVYVGNGCFTDYYGEMLYDSTTSTAYAYTVNNGDMSKLRMLDNGLLSGYYRSSSGWDYTSCYGVVNPKIPEILSNVAWEEPITILPCRNRSGEKYGWINESGKDMIRATYDYIRPFTVNGYIVAANYNDRGNLVYMLLDATTGSVVVRDIKTEAEAINYYDAKAMDSISLHEKIIVSLINMGFDYESSEKFLAALLAEDDYTAEDLYESTRYDTYGTTLYKFWDDIEYDIDDGDLNTEEKVWRIIQKYVAN